MAQPTPNTSYLSDLWTSLTTDSSGDRILLFYWIDAIADVNEAGTVHLFGKFYLRSSESYVSCCLTVRNIPRRVYVLPRIGANGERYPMTQVAEEFSKLAENVGIKEFTTRTVTRKYVFDVQNVPRRTEYLEVTYPAKYPQLPRENKTRVIAHIFETSVNVMELFLIDRGIKGPRWLQIKTPALIDPSRNMSWCKFQIICPDMNKISVHDDQIGEKSLEIPPVTVTTLNVRTSADEKEMNHEILMIAVLTCNNFQVNKAADKSADQEIKCFVTKPKNTSWPENAEDEINSCGINVIKCESEAILLRNFAEELRNSDSDILVGHDCGVQFNMIIRRLFAWRVLDADKISKLRRYLVPLQNERYMLQQMFCRPIADLRFCIMEFCPEIRQVELDALCSTILKTSVGHISDITASWCPQFYVTSQKLIELIKHVVNDASAMMELACETNIINLAVEMTSIVGNNLSRTLSGNKNERNESLLLHAFSSRGFISPDRRTLHDSTKAFTGGLILEPKIGFYDNYTVILDFNSLYPSIILEYNLCFSTIRGVCYKPMDDLALPKKSARPGVLSLEMNKILETRKKVKELLKNPDLTPDLKLQYHIKQRALKLTANSIYGCLGSMYFRFYARNLAAMIAGQGREILLSAKELVEDMDYTVIYGDTDSLIVDTNVKDYDKALRVAEEITEAVNRQYDCIKLGIDGIYQHLLILGRQQYTGVQAKRLADGKLTLSTELKLLEFMRSDWCKLARDTGVYVTKVILTDAPIEEKAKKIEEYLASIAEKMKKKDCDGLIPSLVLKNKLTKNPEQYANATFPHVILARRLNQTSGERKWKAGQFVPYIICDDGTKRPPGQRAYLVNERRLHGFQPDMKYYFFQQVIRAIRKICEPFPELNGEFLAKCLGLQKEFKESSAGTTGGASSVALNVFESVGHEIFSFTCRNCGIRNEVHEFIAVIRNRRVPFLEACPGVQCEAQPWQYVKDILMELDAFVKGLMPSYGVEYQIRCKERNCEFVSDNVVLENSKCPVCTKDSLEKESLLPIAYGKLKFLRKCFDADGQNDKVREGLSVFVTQAYDALKSVVEKHMDLMPYATIDLDAIPW